jgi:hypothetical protein
MKTLAFAALFAVTTGLAAFGSTTDEMELISGGSSIVITDNGANDGNAANGTISYSNSNFNGWNISVASGTSHSPNLTPFGLDLASLTATCASGGCTTTPLQVWYTDLNFTVPVIAGGFQTTFSSTQTGTGTASESAWFSNLNTAFSQQNLIGTVGPFSSSNVGSATGGSVAATPSYSLTLEQVFTDASGTSVSFSVDGNVINAVPEPAAIVLFGTVLALCAAGFRRRFRVSQ